MLIRDIHNDECGLHSSARTLAGKVFRSGFYWPKCFKTPPSLSKHVMHASSTPSKYINQLWAFTPSRSHGPLRSRGWTFWDLSRGRKGATAFFL